MKKQILLFALMLCGASNVFAEEVQIDGLWYDLSGTTAEVIQYKDNVMYSGDVVIPGSVSYNNTDYSVTSIGSNAFRKCSSLTSIVIPNSVTKIEDFAFGECGGLTSIIIPHNVFYIGTAVFQGCHKLTSIQIPNDVAYVGSGAFNTPWYTNQPDGLVYVGKVAYKYKGEMPENTTIDIKDGTISISSYAFNYNCTGLTDINIPESVNNIGDHAFEGTAWYDNQPDGLIYAGKVAYKYKGTMPQNTTIDIVDGTLGIAGSAFHFCYGLTSINIPNSVKTIGDMAFWGSSFLTSIVIPESVEFIGHHAFNYCSSILSIIIPKSVTSIGNGAFDSCSSLTSIIVEDGNAVYDSRNDCNAIIETASNKLIRGCRETIIPGNVTSIGAQAFDYCDFSFIPIPNSVKSIGDYAFCGSSLISVVIPEGVESIGHGVFSSCHRLNSIIVEDGNTAYDSRNDCNAIIETASNTLIVGAGNTIIPDDVTCIGEDAFYGRSSLTSLNVPNSVTSIGNGAFRDTKWFDDQLDGLVYAGKVVYKYKGEMPENTTIDIKEGTLGIAGYAFYGCAGLCSITIPESVTNIGTSAFNGCRNLSAINIPNNITEINYMTFDGCENLKSIILPENVKTIGDCAFCNCTSLSSVKVGMKNPVSLLSQSTFDRCYGATLYVPYGSKEAYQSAKYWNYFEDIVECDYVDVENQNIVTGNSTMTEINMSNYDTNLVAFQMDLTLPEGIGIDKDGCSLSSRITDEEQELTIGKLESGAYRITSTSLSLTPISGNDGTLLSLKLTAEEGSIGGEATISNIIFSTSESDKVVMPDKTFDITVLNKYNLTYVVEGEVYKTEVVVETTPLTPEAEPTKDGYTFGGWIDVPETMPNHDLEITGRFYLYGDVNTDEAVDVVDVVDIARFVVATPSVNFREKLADLNFDNIVNIADAVTLVNYIAGDQNFVKAFSFSGHFYNYDQCQLQLLSTNENTLSLSLDGDTDFTAFQFEVELPQDVDISAMSINSLRKDGHQLLFNKVADNRYRVTALSTSNAAFKGSDGELLNISIDGLPTEEISVQNILFVTQNGRGIAFDGISLSGTVTEIANIRVNEGNDIIYDLQGRKLSEPQRGVNIVNGKKVYYNKQ